MTEQSGSSCVTYRTGQALLAEFEATGAETAFEEIVRLYAGMVYSVCHNVTKNGHDAEDAAQATFLALATQVKTGKTVNALGPWLRQVAKRTALDLRKSKLRREKREDNHSRFSGIDRFNGNLGEAKLESEDYNSALHDELNKLPSRYRLPLVMHYFGGLPPEQTALELNCKPKTLAVRLHRGRKMLAQKLSRRGIFVGGEMLGLASIPYLQSIMGGSIAKSTAAAAAGISGGRDVTAIVSTQVMALVRGAGYAAIISKIKFFVIAMLMCSTFAVGAVTTVRNFVPQNFSWPKLNFNLNEWIRPMFKSGFTAPKLTAQAPATETSEAMKAATSAFALNFRGDGPRATLESLNRQFIVQQAHRSAPRGSVVLASYEPDSIAHVAGVASDDYRDPTIKLVDDSNARTTDFETLNAGSVQLRFATTLPSSDAALAFDADGSQNQQVVWVVSGDDGMASTLVSRGATPTPEPTSLAAIMLAGSLLFRRKVKSKS